MQTLHLFNTYTKEIEIFKPLKDGMVGMYHCGPTVYDYLHIGNMRAYVFADTLRRTCEFLGYEVKQVINITDVGHLVADSDDGEDKMEKTALKENKTAQEVATYYTDIFYRYLSDLNIETNKTLFPKASEHIAEQIELIQKLTDLGHTYTTTDGVYFDVSTWKTYGALGNIDLSGLEAGYRVAFNLEKHTPYDFALWKFSNSDEKSNTKRQQEWLSPWGVGYPGWHIECSAMSMKYLGETFDIHTGGIDHIPVHHNNEIAQSQSVTNKPLANIWMHGAFLNWKDKKMSKSDGSFITLDDLKEKGISPLAFRYFLLQSKYRQQIVFDMETLESSQVAYNRLKQKVQDIWMTIGVENTGFDLVQLTNKLRSLISDDLNTPQFLAYVWEILKDEKNISSASKKDFEQLIISIDKVLGLKLSDSFVQTAENDIPEDIQILIDQRSVAKKEKDWTAADTLRDKAKSLGYELVDTKIDEVDTTRVKKI